MRRKSRRVQQRPMARREVTRPAPPTRASGEKYIPDVRPFMRQYGYTESLEEILADIDRLRVGGNFYYDREDLWRTRT
ncbi:MAG: hypothetical protein IKU26_06475 [Clostridia bacterium]|nr:hypothetical protein [Clostridia bacterium]